MKRWLIAVVMALAVLCCIYTAPTHAMITLEGSYRAMDASMTATYWDDLSVWTPPHWVTETVDPPLKSYSYQGYWNQNIEASVTTGLFSYKVASATQNSNIALDYTVFDSLTGTASGVVRQDAGGTAYSSFHLTFSIDSGNYSYALGVTRNGGPVSTGFTLGGLNNLTPNSSGIIGQGFYYIDIQFNDIDANFSPNPWGTGGTYDTPYDLSFFVEPTAVNPVPIPGAVWLLGSGLFGLIGIGRRRMRK